MNVFKLDFKRNLKSLLIWAGVSAALTALLTALYPSMMNSDMLALMNAKIASLPKELVDAFNLSEGDIRQLPQFFAYMFQFVLMASCIYGATLGLTALSREETDGTIEFLYAKPVTRSGIVSGKLASACLGYFIFSAVVGVAAICACMAVRPDDLLLTDMVSAIKSVIAGGLVAGYTYLFVGFAISVFLKKPRHAGSIAVALFFLTYIVGSIPSMTGVLDFLKWMSPLHYFVPSEVATSGIDGVNALICAAIMGVGAGVTYTVYNRKDFAV